MTRTQEFIKAQYLKQYPPNKVYTVEFDGVLTELLEYPDKFAIVGDTPPGVAHMLVTAYSSYRAFERTAGRIKIKTTDHIELPELWVTGISNLGYSWHDLEGVPVYYLTPVVKEAVTKPDGTWGYNDEIYEHHRRIKEVYWEEAGERLMAGFRKAPLHNWGTNER